MGRVSYPAGSISKSVITQYNMHTKTHKLSPPAHRAWSGCLLLPPSSIFGCHCDWLFTFLTSLHWIQRWHEEPLTSSTSSKAQVKHGPSWAHSRAQRPVPDPPGPLCEDNCRPSTCELWPMQKCWHWISHILGGCPHLQRCSRLTTHTRQSQQKYIFLVVANRATNLLISPDKDDIWCISCTKFALKQSHSQTSQSTGNSHAWPAQWLLLHLLTAQTSMAPWSKTWDVASQWPSPGRSLPCGQQMPSRRCVARVMLFRTSQGLFGWVHSCVWLGSYNREAPHHHWWSPPNSGNCLV